MMKTAVSIQEISEFEIKPEASVNKWRTYVELEISKYWADNSKLVFGTCPTCEKGKSVPAFEKYGISYLECKDCGSLYASSRPNEKELWTWYRESKPSLFWREQILPSSESARLEKILRPRANWIFDGIAEYHNCARLVVDISPHARGLLDILANESNTIEKIVAAGTTADFEGVSTQKIKVHPTLITNISDHGKADVILAVDSLNRAADLKVFVDTLYKTLAPGGLVFVTATVASGFEIQALWDKSPTIIPPDKLNLPTVKSIQRLFGSPSWEIIELSTPGMFDVEMVRQALESERNAPWSRLVRAFVEDTNADGRMAIVELLQRLRLTSFARIVIKKIG